MLNLHLIYLPAPRTIREDSWGSPRVDWIWSLCQDCGSGLGESLSCSAKIIRCFSNSFSNCWPSARLLAQFMIWRRVESRLLDRTEATNRVTKFLFRTDSFDSGWISPSQLKHCGDSASKFDFTWYLEFWLMWLFIRSTCWTSTSSSTTRCSIQPMLPISRNWIQIAGLPRSCLPFLILVKGIPEIYNAVVLGGRLRSLAFFLLGVILVYRSIEGFNWNPDRNLYQIVYTH